MSKTCNQMSRWTIYTKDLRYNSERVNGYIIERENGKFTVSLDKKSNLIDLMDKTKMGKVNTVYHYDTFPKLPEEYIVSLNEYDEEDE